MKRLLLAATIFSGSFAPIVGHAAVINITSSIANASFEAGLGATCPMSWSCGGSPGSGFGSYQVTGLQFVAGSDGLPFNLLTPSGKNAAYSPTGLAGSGTLQQSTSLIFGGGNTYAFDFWIGLPLTEPTSPNQAISGYPNSVTVAWTTGGVTDNLCGNGSAKLQSLTGAAYTSSIAMDNGGCVFNIPNPGAGQWQQFELTYTDVFVNSGTIGVAFGETASSTGQPRIINVDIGAPIPEPMSLATIGIGLAGVAAARRRKSA